MIRYSKPIGKKPSCPFCGLPIDRPKELETKRPQEMPVGTCTCGAVYAYDATGHNLGPAFSEALVFACNMDWDLAWGLLPEEDYLEKLVENYDIETHLIVPEGKVEGRRIPGALYFIRLHRDIQEVTAEGVQRKISRAATIPTMTKAPPAKWNTGQKKYTRRELNELVKEYQVERIKDIAREDKRVIRDLQRLLYSDDELLRLKAADILGKAAAVIALKDPAPVTKLLQGLFTSFEYTASSSWGAVNAIGEIIANSPDIFAGYIPTLYQFLGEKTLRSSALSAIVSIAKSRPDYIQKTAYYFVPYLQDSDPAVRGCTAWLLGFLDAAKAKGDLEAVKDDQNIVKLYENGNMYEKTVGQLAAEALANPDSDQ